LAERIAAFAAAGVTTLAVTPYGDTLEDRLRTLHTGAEALERSGVATGTA